MPSLQKTQEKMPSNQNVPGTKRPLDKTPFGGNVWKNGLKVM